MSDAGAAVRIPVRLTPRGGRDAIDGVVDGVLRARVRAPAVDGAANAALLELLAGELGVPRSHLTLLRGATERRKLVGAAGVDRQVVLDRWPGLAL